MEEEIGGLTADDGDSSRGSSNEPDSLDAMPAWLGEADAAALLLNDSDKTNDEDEGDLVSDRDEGSGDSGNSGGGNDGDHGNRDVDPIWGEETDAVAALVEHGDSDEAHSKDGDSGDEINELDDKDADSCGDGHGSDGGDGGDTGDHGGDDVVPESLQEAEAVQAAILLEPVVQMLRRTRMEKLEAVAGRREVSLVPFMACFLCMFWTSRGAALFFGYHAARAGLAFLINEAYDGEYNLQDKVGVKVVTTEPANGSIIEEQDYDSYARALPTPPRGSQEAAIARLRETFQMLDGAMGAAAMLYLLAVDSYSILVAAPEWLQGILSVSWKVLLFIMGGLVHLETVY